jgi:SAM-dependent methyltransferase
MPRTAYFTRREAASPSEFEEGYWGVVRDPDGKERDLAQERGKKVEDLKAEIAFINAMPAGRILDVGCGLGHLLSGVDPEWERHGVEISEYAAERAATYGTITQGDLRSACYPDAHFDVVTLYHVLEHMEDPVAELREIRRVLKPGGWFVCGTPNFDSACARRFGDRFRMLHDKTHISLFSAESLRRVLEDHGFSVEWEDYPFFDTRYFNRESLERLFDSNQMSPPFYGSIMTFYAHLPERSETTESLALAGRALWRLATDASTELDAARTVLVECGRSEGTLYVWGRGAERHAASVAVTGRRAQAVSGRLPETASPADVLLVLPAGDAPAGLTVDAHQRGLDVLAVVGEESEVDADVIVRVPCMPGAALGAAQDMVVQQLTAESAPVPSARAQPRASSPPPASTAEPRHL